MVGLMIAAVAVALLDLCYQNSGWVQFGYRFSLDYMIFLVLLLALGGILFGGTLAVAVVSRADDRMQASQLARLLREDLIFRVHSEHPDLMDGIIGGSEETTTESPSIRASTDRIGKTASARSARKSRNCSAWVSDAAVHVGLKRNEPVSSPSDRLAGSPSAPAPLSHPATSAKPRPPHSKTPSPRRRRGNHQRSS